jgi:RNA polymerase sigma factor (sigma-70 family)
VPASDPSVVWDERDAILRVVASLPPRQRAAVVLRYYEDLPDDEIAELIGCRPVTVRSLISRALASLRASLPARLLATMGEQQ